MNRNKEHNMVEPVRIAQIIGKLSAGGVEAVITNYYKNINHNKYQFDFFIDEDSQFEPPEEIIEMGAHYYVIPPYKKVFSHIKVLLQFFKRNQYLIVHSNMNTLSVLSLFAAWKAKVPIRINHNHSTASKGETKKNIIKYMLRPFAKVFATDCIACSEYAAEWLFGKEATNSKTVEIFNNAINIDLFDFNEAIREQVRDELGIKDKYVVGHVGRFCFQKNHEFLIDIFESLMKKNNNAILLLIGSGELEESIKEKVKSVGLQNSVIFLGTTNEVYRYYQAMDVFVLPSRYEGLPVVGIEAQTSGLPCLFSTEMTKETQITDNALMVELDKGADYWSDLIIASSSCSRKHTLNEITSAGFDIKTQARHLENYYSIRLNTI